MPAIYPRLAIIILLLMISCTQSPKVPIEPSITPTFSLNSEPALVHIHVQVYGSDTPLRNIQVELYRDQFVPVPGELVQATTTDEQGIANLTVAAGTYGFWVRALDMNTQWRYEGPLRFTFTKDQEILVRMSPAY